MVEEGVKRIDRRAFYDCTKLTEVFLPASLECLHVCAFEHCGSLKSIHVKWTSIPEYINRLDNFLEECAPLERVTLCVPTGTKGIFEQSSQFSKFKDIIEE